MKRFSCADLPLKKYGDRYYADFFNQFFESRYEVLLCRPSFQQLMRVTLPRMIRTES
jgi:hypothetical protein